MTALWKKKFTLQDLQKRCESTLSAHLGIIFTEIGDRHLTAEITLQPHHLQPDGILHGGTSAAFAETIASVAASCAVDPKTYTCVGLELNINHIKAVHSGRLIAKTFPYHIGRSTQVWGIEIRNQQERVIAIARLTVSNLLIAQG